MTASLQKTTEKTVAQTAAKHAASQGGLLPCLHEIQAELGYIPNEHLENIATAFSLSTAEVHGVVSFYHDFRTSPSIEYSDLLCRGLSGIGAVRWRLALPMFWVLSLTKRTQRIAIASSECTVWAIVPAVPRFALTTYMDVSISPAYLS